MVGIRRIPNRQLAALNILSDLSNIKFQAPVQHAVKMLITQWNFVVVLWHQEGGDPATDHASMFCHTT